MLDILIYLRDDQYEAELVEVLKGRNYIYHRAGSTEEVLNICNQDFIDFILVWPADAGTVSELQSNLSSHNLGYIPVIAAVRDEQELQAVAQLPVSDVFGFPLIREEFYTILDQISKDLERDPRAQDEHHWHGNLDEFSLVDLIQMVEASQKDAVLTISYAEHLGQVYFRHGKVISATLRHLSGIAVLEKLLSLRRGNFHVQFTRVDLTDTVQMSNRELLVEMMNRLKDQEKFSENIPDLTDIFVSRQKISSDELDEVEAAILHFCREGKSLNNMLISLDFRNVDLLKRTAGLLDKQYLKRQQEGDLPVGEEAPTKMGRLFKGFKKIFRKEKEMASQAESPPPVAEPEELPEPEIIRHIQPLGEDYIRSLQKYFEKD